MFNIVNIILKKNFLIFLKYYFCLVIIFLYFVCINKEGIWIYYVEIKDKYFLFFKNEWI